MTKMLKFRARARRWWRKDIRPILILLAVMCSIRSSLADWNVVPTGSMKPTILEGDYVFVNKVAYDLKVPFTRWHLAEWSNPQRGEVVVFFSPYDEMRLVKRVVGLPGDVIELRHDQLYVNGNPMSYGPLDARISDQLPESERSQSVFATEQLSAHNHAVMAIPGRGAKRDFGPVTVPADHFFMLGDNRDNSFDSRYYGAVERKRIVGRATGVVLSLNKANYWLPRNRFFKSLDVRQKSD
jgi:signal peptidase I